MGTRALMQQQGLLLSYDGQVARIGIKSKPLFKMAQGRVTNIETAFQALLNQPVKVTLEVAEGVASSPPASPIPQTSPPLPPTNDNPAPPAHPGMPPVAPPPPVSPATPRPLEQGTSGSPPQASEPTAPPAWTPTSDFDRAVKSFAEFFNGQIVSMSDEEQESSKNGKKSKGKDAKIKPPSPDSDVPF